ncbi:MAG: c-type cytochrome [Thermodesulfobacteriota bacterium]
MKKTVILVILMVLALTAGCAARQTPIPDPGSADAMLYRAKCGACHVVAHPKRHTYAQWVHLVGRMEKKMPPMNAGERDAILDYLKRHSR